ncbi:MAG: nucleotide exchange factor GrpE [Lachnospiraceae bacterium]|nr:nucleotide exchange factor GrpE [Lachnospiraceae bacterium]
MADLKEKLLKESVEAAKKKAEAEAEKAKAEKEKAEETIEEAAEEVEKAEGTVENAAESTEGEGGELPPDDSPIKDGHDKKDEKIAELNDRLIRNLAEFDNFRKRTDKEKSQMFEMGAKSIIEKILPAIDSFELGMAAMSEEDRASGVGQGMEKIYKQLMTILEGAGVKQIEALGKEFDPNLHNAVMHEENEEFGENTVSQELQKGYMYNDSVIRHSMVKVAN